MIFDFILIIRKDYLIYDVFQLTSRLVSEKYLGLIFSGLG